MPQGSRQRFRLPRQLIECQALADDALHGKVEAFGVSHLAVVVAIGLFVQIAEQVERLDADIGSADQAAFQQAPEVLQTVGVDIAVDVLLRRDR